MTYEKALEFINLSNQYGSVLGLATITQLLARLDNPQEQLKIIHVAGTNGKGSTTAFISSILAAQGYSVGRYISPAVFDYLERVQITRQRTIFPSNASSAMEQSKLHTEYISKEGVATAIEKIAPVCEAMVRDGYAHPTSFEIETAMAFLYLLSEKVDYAVVEVGLGGRLDATNVINNPICSVITSISMDHMQYLGDTLEKIAYEKAGIIKLGVPVVTNNQADKVLQTLSMVCEEKQTKLKVVDGRAISEIDYSVEGTLFTFLEQRYRIRLLGKHQIENATLAILTALTLNHIGHTVSNQAIINGLYWTRWVGRFEMLQREPYVIIDGAHNEDAAYKLRETIETYFPTQKIIYIMGVFADKDYKSILRITAPLADTIITITPGNNRALPATLLAKEAQNYTKNKVIDAKNLQQAITYAYSIASKEDVIIAFGSLSFLGEIKDLLGR